MPGLRRTGSRTAKRSGRCRRTVRAGSVRRKCCCARRRRRCRSRWHERGRRAAWSKRMRIRRKHRAPLKRVPSAVDVSPSPSAQGLVRFFDTALPPLPPKPPAPSVRINPIVMRFFYVPSSDISTAEERELPAGWFVNDQGETAAGFPDSGTTGYCNLYINGLMQGASVYDISPAAVSIKPTGQTIPAGTPIIVESVSFQAATSAEK